MATVLALAAACSGDDDTADETTVVETAPVTTAAATTEPPTTPAATDPPATTEEPATTTAATDAPTTTQLDEEALKAEIAADYAAVYQLREEILLAPTLNGLAELMPRVAAPGSPSSESFEAFVRELVEKEERFQLNEPDISTVMAQKVELSGSAPYTEALVSGCLLTNQLRVDRDGARIAGGGLGAAQQVQVLVLTDFGWVPSEPITEETVTSGVSECPAI